MLKWLACKVLHIAKGFFEMHGGVLGSRKQIYNFLEICWYRFSFSVFYTDSYEFLEYHWIHCIFTC
jgi:hypothetical protein